MTSAVQVQYRRGSASQVGSFTGAQGEMVVDTTNNRVVVQDGATAGGWPAAKLSEVVTNARTQVSDGNYSALTADRTVAYIALTAARVVSLPAASTYPTGSRLLVVDESGACSATKTITLTANGSDLIDGAASAVINSAYGYLALESNGFNKWTIIDQVTVAPVASVNALTGTISIASSGGSSITASGTTVTIGEPGGMLNKFRNGTMDVWQRGTSGAASTTAGALTQTGPDGWYIAPTGAGVTWAQAGGRLLTKNSLQVTGATSVTGLIVKQRIESLIAAAFCSQTVTVQAQIYNGTGGAITPKLSVNRATGQDNGTYTNVDVSAVSLQSCPANAWTLVSYTFATNANSYNGLEIIFDFGNNFGANTKTVQITECDFRVTPGASTGLNSTPPPPELRPIPTELTFCQRYLPFAFNATTGSTTNIVTGGAYTTANAEYQFQYPPTRVAVTGVTISSAAHFFSYDYTTGNSETASAIALKSSNSSAAFIYTTVSSGLTAGGFGVFASQNASAQLLLTGAEL